MCFFLENLKFINLFFLKTEIIIVYGIGLTLRGRLLTRSISDIAHEELFAIYTVLV